MSTEYFLQWKVEDSFPLLQKKGLRLGQFYPEEAVKQEV